MYFDTLVRNDDANHVIARNRVAAFGNDVVELLDIVAQQEAFGLVFHLRLDGILQVERVALRLRRVLGLVAGTAPAKHLPEPVFVFLFLRFEDRLDIFFLYLVHGHIVEKLRFVLAREGILYRPDVFFGKRHGKGSQYLLQGIAALVIVTGVFLAQPLAYLGFGTGGNHIVEPGLARLLGLGSDDFHLVAVLEFLVDGHQFVVHFGSNHGETDFGMDMEGKVEHGGTRRQALDLAGRRIDIDFAVEEVLPEVVQETQRIVRGGMFQHFLYLVQPEVEPGLSVGIDAFVLVAPVGCIASFGYFIHPFGTNLHLYPPPCAAHDSSMQGLVAVGFGYRDPVAQPVGICPVEAVDNGIDTVAVGFFVLHRRIQHNPDRKQVIDFLEGNSLLLHLAPNGTNGLDTARNRELEAFRVQFLANRVYEVVNQILSFRLALLDFLGDKAVDVRLGVFHGQVLQFALDGEKPQTVGEGSIDVDGLGCNLELLVASHGVERAHVVQAVG